MATPHELENISENYCGPSRGVNSLFVRTFSNGWKSAAEGFLKSCAYERSRALRRAPSGGTQPSLQLVRSVGVPDGIRHDRTKSRSPRLTGGLLARFATLSAQRMPPAPQSPPNGAWLAVAFETIMHGGRTKPALLACSRTVGEPAREERRRAVVKAVGHPEVTPTHLLLEYAGASLATSFGCAERHPAVGLGAARTVLQ